MANLDVIAFECPRCLHKLRVAKEQAGNRIECSSCNESLTVPGQSADAGLFDDLFDSPADSGNDVPATPSSSSEPRHYSTAELEGDWAEAASPSKEKNPLQNLLDEQTSGGKVNETSPRESDSELDPLADLVIPGSADLTAPTLDPDAGKDPFEVDPDAPLKVDGVGDLFSNADVFGIKCHVCDTRIHVRSKQIGANVECPICYSKVEVRAPQDKTSLRWEKKAGVKPDGDSENKKSSKNRSSTKSHIRDDDDELKLSAPVERPKVEIDPSYGLAPVEDDLLAPKPPSLDQSEGSASSLDHIPELIVVDDANDGQADVSGQAGVRSRSKGASSRKSKTNKASKKNPKSGKSSGSAQADAAGARSTHRGADTEGAKDFPEFELMGLLSAAIEMIKSPGVFSRVAIAFAIMCLGAISMEWVSPLYVKPIEGAEPSMFEGMVQSAKWLVGAGIYVVGLSVLWWTSSYLFRDAALGKRKVAGWSNAGSSEIISTFLLFTFAFFIGGLPAAFLTLVILPLRVLLGPLFLLSAWYNQSPFAIVSVDAFQSASQNLQQWRQFYMFAGGLAFLSIVAGLLFWMRAVLPFFLGLPVMCFGIAITIVVTLLFSVVCGWHCGRVIESLENTE